jgi:hypothetical protein
MAQVNQVQSISMPAAADLSALQFTFVNINSSGEAAAPSGAGGDAVGVLMNKPDAAGRAAEVAYAGKAKVKAGATVAAGAKVQTDANGAAITAASGDVVLGCAMSGGDSGEVIEVLLVSQHILA